jgi:hypothetical protein
MTFSMLKLSGERVVVRGTDQHQVEGSTVLNAAEWNAIKRSRDGDQAEKEFDRTVEQFFSPLTQAAEKLAKSRRGEDADPSTYVVIDEGTEGTAGRPRRVASLSRDSIVLRLLEEGDDARLVWVNDQLEVLEVVPGTNTATPVVGGGVEPHEVNEVGQPEDIG